MKVLIIPAAGNSSRAKTTIPKCLVEYNGVVILNGLIRKYYASIDKILLVIQERHLVFFEKKLEPTYMSKIDFVFQNRPLGMGDALKLASNRLKEYKTQVAHIYVSWSDLFGVSMETVNVLLQVSSKGSFDCLVPIRYVSDPYTVVHISSHGEISGVYETKHDSSLRQNIGWRELGIFYLSAGAFSKVLTYLKTDDTCEIGWLSALNHAISKNAIVAFPLPSLSKDDAKSFNYPKDLE